MGTPQCTQTVAAAAQIHRKTGFCCIAIRLERAPEAALMHIFQRNSACATLKTAAALRNK
jgi:hypothetical protein